MMKNRTLREMGWAFLVTAALVAVMFFGATGPTFMYAMF
jgi:hypothetical protein